MGHAKWIFNGNTVDIDVNISLPDEVPYDILGRLMQESGYQSLDEVRRLGTEGAFVVGSFTVTETDDEFVINADFKMSNPAGMRLAIMSVVEAFSLDEGSDSTIKIIFRGADEIPVCRGFETDGPIKYALAAEIFSAIGIHSTEDVHNLEADDIRTDLVGSITAKYFNDTKKFSVEVDVNDLDDPKTKATIIGAVGESLNIGSPIDLFLLEMSMEVKEDHESRRIRN